MERYTKHVVVFGLETGDRQLDHCQNTGLLQRLTMQKNLLSFVPGIWGANSFLN